VAVGEPAAGTNPAFFNSGLKRGDYSFTMVSESQLLTGKCVCTSACSLEDAPVVSRGLIT
jgi:hypothetical protein